ncbi:unnamed protein product [Dicrocoelium dendriticum]|nr:unnamed protein product [Dicrocoelium dendriticum]
MGSGMAEVDRRRTTRKTNNRRPLSPAARRDSRSWIAAFRFTLSAGGRSGCMMTPEPINLKANRISAWRSSAVERIAFRRRGLRLGLLTGTSPSRVSLRTVTS